jgi:hypothetical protein
VKYTQSILNKDLSSELPPPQSFRRGLVFGVGFGLFLVSIIIANNMWEYFIEKSTNIYEISLLIWSIWGISYVGYLWISFLFIGFKKLPGCEFTAISHWLLKKNIHICVDSILNSRLDKMQKEIGISPKLLKTESAQKWIAGFLLLLVLIFFLAINFLGLFVNLILIGLFSSVYFLYDITIHRFTIGRKDLTGKGDYPRLLSEFLKMLKNSVAEGMHMSLSLGKDWKLTILRLILIGWGVINVPLGVYTGSGMANPDTLPSLHNEVSVVYERMLAAIYIPLGICAILAAFNPIRHKLLIIFIIVSSFAHAGVMTFDYFTTNLHVWPGLTIGSLNLYATAIVFLVFYPYGKVEPNEV